MARLALWVAVAVLAAGCGDADAAGGPSTDLVRVAAPLVEAHGALEAHAEQFAAAPEAAAAEWAAVEARVAAAVEELTEPHGLGLEPRERSKLGGYARGLEIAGGGWAEAHAALAAGGRTAAARAAERAHERMRHLDRLRRGVTP